MEKSFEIRNLSLQIGNFSLKNINLHLSEHSYLMLLGKIGSGKTVLLKTIAGIYRNHEGVIFLDGQEISSLPPRDRGVGYVPQHNDLFPNMNVYENIAFPIGLRGKIRISNTEKYKIVTELLELMGIGDIKNRLVQNLSGGERKKVAIARAIASKPRLLLLDEPLSMLDAQSRASIIEILRKFHRESEISVIHVSHDRRDAWELAKLCAVMENGTISQFGSTYDVFRCPITSSIADFLGCENIIPAKFAKSDNKSFAIINDNFKLEILSAPEREEGWIVIRPELIQIGYTQSGNNFEAKVIAIIDKGDICEIRISIAEIELTLHCGFSEAASLSCANPGQFSVSPHSIHIIPFVNSKS